MRLGQHRLWTVPARNVIWANMATTAWALIAPQRVRFRPVKRSSSSRVWSLPPLLTGLRVLPPSYRGARTSPLAPALPLAHDNTFRKHTTLEFRILMLAPAQPVASPIQRHRCYRLSPVSLYREVVISTLQASFLATAQPGPAISRRRGSGRDRVDPSSRINTSSALGLPAGPRQALLLVRPPPVAWTAPPRPA
ncbi:hypothetical protein K525DRAFT_269810 [Schizophyllum commune Loenen D]|nr:hypothetical protein K525DRAFT_269810 [Schizophyllum commune Loenen D]